MVLSPQGYAKAENLFPQLLTRSHVVPQLADYTYDALNRIGSYTEAQYSGSWSYNVAGQTFGYDRYGNRQITATAGGVNNYNPSYTASTNRIVGLTYDSAGNITNDGSKAMTYDAENHMVSATGGSYVYDGEGKRVKRTATGQEWWYIYGLGGELVAEYLSTAPTAVQKEYGYRSGQLLIVGESGNVRWLVTDHLGSTRMTAESTGSLTAMKRHDYLPFGEELYAGIRRNGGNGQYGYEPPASNLRQRFTGHERDSETGLDYVKARYRSSIQGRFISADPWLPVLGGSDELIAIYSNQPQHWNRYSYAVNNPLAFVDPDGENPLIVAGAFAGAIIGGGSKYLEYKLSGKEVDWNAVGSAALNGGIQGAVAGATGGASFAVQLSTGVGASIVGGIAERAINHRGNKSEVLKPEEVIKDTVSGLIGGGTSAKVVSGLNKLLYKSRVMSSIAEQAPDAAFDVLSAAYSLSRKHILRRKTIGNPAIVDWTSQFGQALPKQFLEQGYEKGWDYMIGSFFDWAFQPSGDITMIITESVIKEDGSEEPWIDE